jgi:DNA recombination protein RmuC
MVLISIVTGLLAGAVVALVAWRVLAARLGHQTAADREVTVRHAVEATLAVASDRLGQHAQAGARELELHRRAIGDQLHSMDAELRSMSDLVATLQRERAEQHGALVRGLDETMRATAKLADTTQSLRQALASPKARGQWGERMADDVLRLAGMCEGVNYLKQKAIAGGRVPDFTFLLPQGLFLHMDVKFPVDNYLRYLEAATDTERSAFRDTFLRDVRARVKELAGRGYADDASTVGYQLLFIPNESVYSFIAEHQPDLSETAMAQRVILCSPFTLFAVLGVVRQAVDNFLLERTTDEILAAMTGFSRQWERFSEQIDLVGRRLASAQTAYDDLSGTRRRQLQRQLDEIEQIRTDRGVEPDPESGGDELRVLPNASNL